MKLKNMIILLLSILYFASCESHTFTETDWNTEESVVKNIVIEKYLNFRKIIHKSEEAFVFSEELLSFFTPESRYHINRSNNYDKTRAGSYAKESVIKRNQLMAFLEKKMKYSFKDFHFIESDSVQISCEIQLPNYKKYIKENINESYQDLADFSVEEWLNILNASERIIIEREIYFNKKSDQWLISLIPPHLNFYTEELYITINKDIIDSIITYFMPDEIFNFSMISYYEKNNSIYLIDSNYNNYNNSDILELIPESEEHKIIFSSKENIGYPIVDNEKNLLYYFKFENIYIHGEPNHQLRELWCFNIEKKTHTFIVGNIENVIGKFPYTEELNKEIVNDILSIKIHSIMLVVNLNSKEITKTKINDICSSNSNNIRGLELLIKFEKYFSEEFGDALHVNYAGSGIGDFYNISSLTTKENIPLIYPTINPGIGVGGSMNLKFLNLTNSRFMVLIHDHLYILEHDLFEVDPED